MKEFKRGIIFFIGWLLSPFTWWNDVFVNIPLSYLIASGLFHFIHLRFGALMLGVYWATNVAGIFLMFFSGKDIVLSSKNKIKSIAVLIIFVVLYSMLMIYLDKHGKLLPLCRYFGKF